MNHDAKLPTNHHSCKKQTWSFVNDHKRPQKATKRQAQIAVWLIFYKFHHLIMLLSWIFNFFELPLHQSSSLIRRKEIEGRLVKIPCVLCFSITTLQPYADTDAQSCYAWHPFLPICMLSENNNTYTRIPLASHSASLPPLVQAQ